MTFEQQFISREVAQKMAELGFPDDSWYVWMWVTRRSILQKDGRSYKTRQAYWKLTPRNITKNCPNQKYPAYTVAELGYYLPEYISVGSRNCYLLRVDKNSDSDWFWAVGYFHRSESCHQVGCSGAGWFVREQGETEADARGKMLIYLKEKNLL